MQESSQGKTEGAHETNYENGPLEPGKPLGATSQAEIPEGRENDKNRRDDPGPELVPGDPQTECAHCHHRSQGRSQSHGVILVENAGHEAENEPGDGQPTSERNDTGPAHVSANGPADNQQADDNACESQRSQPGNLRTELAAEQAIEASLAPLAAATFTAVAGYDGSFLAAGQASKTVVAKGELKEGVALGAAYIRSVAGWHDDRQQYPPASGDDHGTNGGQ